MAYTDEQVANAMAITIQHLAQIGREHSQVLEEEPLPGWTSEEHRWFHNTKIQEISQSISIVQHYKNDLDTE